MKTKNSVLAAVLIALMLLMPAIFLAGCAGGELSNGEPEAPSGAEQSPEQRLAATLSDYTDEEVLWFLCDDFDGDEVMEAFAFTGKDDPAGSGLWQGKPWFITENYAAELTPEGLFPEPQFLSTDGDDFVKFETTAASGSTTLLFGVANSRVFEPPISGKVMNLTQVSETEFTATHSTFDAGATEGVEGELTELGHTWKTYWFYYENGEFREYGARDGLKRSDLKEWPTGAAVLRQLYENGLTELQLERLEAAGALKGEKERERVAEKAGYIRSILLRGNGLVHLNYYGADNENYYVTFKIEGDDLAVVDEGSGYYLPAMLEQIAVYPPAPASESGEEP